MIEPFSRDDNPQTQYRSITELGQELVSEDAHREYISGLRYVVDRWRGSIVCIYSDKGIGTGFFVTSRLVVTARHVLEGLGEYKLADQSNQELSVDSVRFPQNEEIDLALITLKTESKSVVPMRIARGHDVLDEVVVFGYPPVPHADDSYLLVNKGEVSADIKLRNGMQAVLVTCLLKGGYSGGPVLNRRGQVVGVVSKNLFSMMAPGEHSINEALGFAAAVPSEWVSDLVAGKI